MKKISLIIFAAVMLIFSACSAEAKTEVVQPEIVKVECDRVVYDSIDELKSAADIIVVAKFEGDAEQKLSFEFSDEFNKEVLVDAVSKNTAIVSKVIKGSADIDKITVSQRYGVTDDKTLVSFSEMTPMKKGEQWIMFLYYDEVNDTYWSVGDYCGRYPKPDDKLNTLLTKLEEIQQNRANWLKGKETVSKEEVASKVKDGSGVFTSQDGVNYIIGENDWEQFASYDEEIRALTEETEAADFGLLDKAMINTELYGEVIKCLNSSL